MEVILGIGQMQVHKMKKEKNKSNSHQLWRANVKSSGTFWTWKPVVCHYSPVNIIHCIPFPIFLDPIGSLLWDIQILLDQNSISARPRMRPLVADGSVLLQKGRWLTWTGNRHLYVWWNMEQETSRTSIVSGSDFSTKLIAEDFSESIVLINPSMNINHGELDPASLELSLAEYRWFLISTENYHHKYNKHHHYHDVTHLAKPLFWMQGIVEQWVNGCLVSLTNCNRRAKLKIGWTRMVRVQYFLLKFAREIGLDSSDNKGLNFKQMKTFDTFIPTH